MLPIFLFALAAAEPAAVDATPPAVAAMMEKKPAGEAEAANLPPGAPSDDYGFVAWCHGALNGHMELYEMVKPELTKLDRTKEETEANAKLEEEQMAAGRDYLALYSRALIAAERASPNAIHQRGMQADTQGYRIWAPAKAADPKNRMWAWLTWELPARCEIAATRLEERSSLFAETFRQGGDGPEPGNAWNAPSNEATKAPDVGLPAEN